MKRVLLDDICEDVDIVLYNGNPFTGIGFSCYPSGSLESEIFYMQGYQIGIQADFYQNGYLDSVGYYKNNLLLGPELFYSENGNLIRAVWLHNGEKVRDKIVDTTLENQTPSHVKKSTPGFDDSIKILVSRYSKSIREISKYLESIDVEPPIFEDL